MTTCRIRSICDGRTGEIVNGHKKKLLAAAVTAVLLLGLLLPAFSSDYKSIDMLNSKNLASYFGDLLGFKYDSHGCLHFSPSDIYLLYRVVPKGMPLRIKPYGSRPPYDLEKIKYLNEMLGTQKDIASFAKYLEDGEASIVVYPSLGRLMVMINGSPYAQMRTLAGPPYVYRMVSELPKGAPVEWGGMIVTPTDPGNYRILGSTPHYISNAYRANTIVPFGGWMVRNRGRWLYQDGRSWRAVPGGIADDLDSGYGSTSFRYYDVNYGKDNVISSARWGGHDYGKYVLKWTKDGRTMYPEIGYCSGDLLIEQVNLVNDLSQILTAPGSDDAASCMESNINFTMYKKENTFVRSNGEEGGNGVDTAFRNYFKFYNGIEMTEEEKRQLDPRMVRAYAEFKLKESTGNVASLNKDMLGLYAYLKLYDTILRKEAYWYQKIKDDWDFWGALKASLRDDLNKMGISDPKKRQYKVREWLEQRLEFRTVKP